MKMESERKIVYELTGDFTGIGQNLQEFIRLIS